MKPTPNINPDPTRDYYVTMIRATGGHTGKRLMLSGPYSGHARAMADVERVSLITIALDPDAVWDAYGTTSVARDGSPGVPGVLQRQGVMTAPRDDARPSLIRSGLTHNGSPITDNQ